MPNYPAPLRFPAAGRHTATVIFIHGLGDSGHGWAPAVENWRRRQKLDEVKFILPHAPTIPVTCNMGMRMPGWYDIVSRTTVPRKSIDGTPESLRKDEDEEGILLSQKYFHELIQQEIDAGIPSERIVLGGFSQGGVMSIFSGLTAKVKLAAIVAMSAYVPLSLKFKELVASCEANKATPIWMGHGTTDLVVPTVLGMMSEALLKDEGYQVSMKLYPGMGHSACPEELDEVEAFLRKSLPPWETQAREVKMNYEYMAEPQRTDKNCKASLGQKYKPSLVDVKMA
ncbi:hypothetical protein MCOR02_000574 [Pyricularia oryzae]|nr:hypothetical protein MCOR02_000574 [Pyricularia oryzae]